jgi:hypothetical protein
VTIEVDRLPEAGRSQFRIQQQVVLTEQVQVAVSGGDPVDRVGNVAVEVVSAAENVDDRRIVHLDDRHQEQHVRKARSVDPAQLGDVRRERMIEQDHLRAAATPIQRQRAHDRIRDISPK